MGRKLFSCILTINSAITVLEDLLDLIKAPVYCLFPFGVKICVFWSLVEIERKPNAKLDNNILCTCVESWCGFNFVVLFYCFDEFLESQMNSQWSAIYRKRQLFWEFDFGLHEDIHASKPIRAKKFYVQPFVQMTFWCKNGHKYKWQLIQADE